LETAVGERIKTNNCLWWPSSINGPDYNVNTRGPDTTTVRTRGRVGDRIRGTAKTTVKTYRKAIGDRFLLWS